MDMKTWRLDLGVSRGDNSVAVYRVMFKATEEKADEFLDALILGFELKDYSAGGGMVVVPSE